MLCHHHTHQLINPLISNLLLVPFTDNSLQIAESLKQFKSNLNSSYVHNSVGLHTPICSFNDVEICSRRQR